LLDIFGSPTGKRANVMQRDTLPLHRSVTIGQQPATMRRTTEKSTSRHLISEPARSEFLKSGQAATLFLICPVAPRGGGSTLDDPVYHVPLQGKRALER